MACTRGAKTQKGLKMSFQHKELFAGRWKTLPFVEQMTTIGSEVERAFN